MIYDVIVCGGGPAGTAAAVSAARWGASVCLIERYGFTGGMATSGLINPWLGHAFRCPDSQRSGSLIGGFFKEIVSVLRAEGAYGSKLTASAFDEERLKFVYDRLLKNAGVHVYLHSPITSLNRSGQAIRTVSTTSKSGVSTYQGKYFIDATGDGDVAALAGCEYSIGRPADGLTQAMTMSFRMANVDKGEFLKQNSLRKARMLVEPYFQEARSNGSLDYPHRDFVHFYDYPRPGVLHFNMTRVNQVSGLSIEDLTHAEIEGRRQAFVLSDWLIKAVPYFRDAYLMKTACQVGVRETRHVKGLYTMTREDVVEAHKFEDAIVRSAYPIDIHSPIGSGFDHEKAGTRGEFDASYKPPDGDYYEVPYRAIVPANADNLLVACRALSADHEAAAAIRVMATMTGVGQAAGIAAARAAKLSLPLYDLDGRWLRHELGYLDRGPDFSDIW